MTAALKRPHFQIWAIAGPAIIANSSAPIVGLVDTWVIGHLPGAVHLAAVSVGAMVFSYIFWGFGFLRMSTTGLVAQAFGKKDQRQLAGTVVRSIALGLIIALGLLALQELIFTAALWALAPPETTLALFEVYFDIRIWSAPAALLLYSINGYLIGTAQAKKALWIQLVLNITNGVLNLVLVLGFDLGVAGIAIGSLIAEWLAAGLGLLFLAKGLSVAALTEALKHQTTWARTHMVKLLGTNGFIFVRTLLLMTALGMVTRKAGSLGEAPLAASHVLSTFLMLISLGLDGFAYAAEALAGAAFGKGVRRDFRAWVIFGLIWAGAAALLYSAGFYLAGEALIYALTDIEAVRTAAVDALPVIIALPILAVWCYQFDGVYIGATAGGAMLGTMAVGFAVFVLSADMLTAAMGLKGLWVAVALFMAVRGLGQAIWYPRLERTLS